MQALVKMSERLVLIELITKKMRLSIKNPCMKKISLIICIYNFTTVLENLFYRFDIFMNLDEYLVVDKYLD